MPPRAGSAKGDLDKLQDHAALVAYAKEAIQSGRLDLSQLQLETYAKV